MALACGWNDLDRGSLCAATADRRNGGGGIVGQEKRAVRLIGRGV